jgi:hypothetical protein
MPSWIHNELQVTGNSKAIKFFARMAKGRMGKDRVPFSLQSFVPMPKALNNTKSPNPDNLPTWYEWCPNNWGTKWDVCEPKLTDAQIAGLTYTFDTAWAPPDKALRAIKAMFPTLNLNNTWTDEDEGFTEEHHKTY